LVLRKGCSPFRAKGPGLKPLGFMGFIQRAEAPCSLQKAKTGVFPHIKRNPEEELSGE
jgi:hypothetical protein